jgi:hypothetical protein
MKDKNILGVALVKEACPICGKEQDGPIIMNTRLTENLAKQVEDLHGKVIGYSKEPCTECQDLMSKGFLLIECDESKTEDRKNPWRTGRQWVVTHEAANRMFKGVDLSKGIAFIPIEVSEAIGLKIQEDDHTRKT